MTKLAFGAVPALIAPMTAADEIRVLNRQGYGADLGWAAAEFQAATGRKVVHGHFTSEQEMPTKLRADPGAYDVAPVNSAFTGQTVEEGLRAPIDKALVPNLADIDPANPGLNAGGALHGAPWTWGLAAFAVNAASLSAFRDPAWKGRVSIRDDALEAVRIAALAAGQDIHETADMGAIKGELEALTLQIRAVRSSENDWNPFMAAGGIAAVNWSGSAARAIDTGLPSAFVIPEAGATGGRAGCRRRRPPPARRRRMPSSTGRSPPISTSAGTRKARPPRPTPGPPPLCPRRASTAARSAPGSSRSSRSCVRSPTPGARNIRRCGRARRRSGSVMGALARADRRPCSPPPICG